MGAKLGQHMAHMATDCTVDELICVCIARQVADGDVLAQGIATPLVMAGYLLAKHTHAPNVSFASAIGNAMVDEPGAVGLARVEELWLGRALMTFGFAQAACELLPRFQPKEFFRPAQVDAAGNFNNVVIGTDYDHPRMRLPGCGGIADVTAYYREIYLYVPRHSRVVFVEQVDFVSGLGHSEGRRSGAGPCYLVSNLGQFDFADGRMRLIARHPGVTVEKICTKTGFALKIAPDLPETEPPTVEEVRLLREVIDPLGVRRLETLSGAARKRVLREILASEWLATNHSHLTTNRR
jgi:acyl CoA:acetate/3-ketoacid CoA transferase beta subunit